MRRDSLWNPTIPYEDRMRAALGDAFDPAATYKAVSPKGMARAKDLDGWEPVATYQAFTIFRKLPPAPAKSAEAKGT